MTYDQQPAPEGHPLADVARYAAAPESGGCQCGYSDWWIYATHAGPVRCQCLTCGRDGTEIVRAMLARPHNAPEPRRTLNQGGQSDV